MRLVMMALFSAALFSTAAQASPFCSQPLDKMGQCVWEHGYVWRAHTAPALRFSRPNDLQANAYAICDTAACQATQPRLPDNVAAMLSNVTAGHKLEGNFEFCRYIQPTGKKAKKPATLREVAEATCLNNGAVLKVVPENKQ